ncbi:MAG: cyclic nucleotide-binding/CBS domain-containing protein [Gammaproteobacteria bacterium]
MRDEENIVETVMSEADRKTAQQSRLQSAGLSVHIGDLYSLYPPVSCEPGTSIRAAVRIMHRSHTGFILIVQDERLLGIFTERDLLNAVAGEGVDLDATPVDAVMTAGPECLGRDYDLVYAINQMSVGGYRHVPILDERGRPVNVISPRNVVEHLADQFPKEVLNLPPSPQNTISDALEGA